MTCKQWDLVVVPFPFTDQPGHKRRPALVLSGQEFNRHGHSVLSMVTTSTHHPWPGDVHLTDSAEAGLDVPCMVRLKLFTLDNRLLIRRLGSLSSPDRGRVVKQIRSFLP